MKKELYYQLSDNADVSMIVMDLSGAMEWIKSDMENASPDDDEEKEFTLAPIWLTEEEYENLPEANF